MNKSVVLGMAMALGVTASAYAANPFSDVPANSWAYDAVNKLAAEGIIDGYPNGTFGGDRLMTRYEMAQIVAKAMAKGANVDRLAAEFADELDSLGVRVAGLEKKSDNVKITGEIRARYVDQKAKANQGSKYDSDLRSRLWLNGQINDDWTYTAMIQNIQDFSNDQGDEGTDFKRAYVNGRVGGVGLQAGRIDAFLADGNIMDAQADGLVATYGDRIKVKAYMGKASDDTDFDVNNVIATKKGDLLTLLAWKGINLLSDIKNKIITIVGKSKNAWNPNEVIIAGDIRYTEDGNGPSWAYLLCKTAGTTGTVEPILEANAVVGQEINDGSVVWTVQNIRPTALDSYPVGSIYMSVNSTSPADLFGGTWEAMPAGRVLLAQGTSEWGVEYQAGSTGGEHEHQLSVGELPEHDHTATCNTAGEHNHSLTVGYDVSDGTGWGKYMPGTNRNLPTSSSGSHVHAIDISNTGSNISHNNMQPFLSVYMWYRID